MTNVSSKSVDLLIVGAGPVGLFGAYYAGVRLLSTAVLDSLEEPGGQITAMYPEKAIFDVAGFPAIKGRELVDQLLKQAAPFKPDYLLGHQAVGLERGDGGFAVTTSTGHRIECRAIVITGGIGTFTPRPLPTGGEYLGRGLVHFVPEPVGLRRAGHRGGRRRRLGARLGADARADRPVGDDRAPPRRVPRPPALGRAAQGVVGRDDHRRAGLRRCAATPTSPRST